MGSDSTVKKERKEKKRSESDGVRKAKKEDKKSKKEAKERKEKLAAVAESLLESEAAADNSNNNSNNNSNSSSSNADTVTNTDTNAKKAKDSDGTRTGVVDDVVKRPSKRKTAAGPVGDDDLNPIATPIADEKQTKKILKAVRKAAKNNRLKRGVKEVTKAVRKTPIAPRSSTSFPGAVVVLAGDIWPIDVISHLPVACEDRNVPYIYVRSRAALGDAACTKRPTSVVMLVEKEADGAKKKERLKKAVETNKEITGKEGENGGGGGSGSGGKDEAKDKVKDKAKEKAKAKDKGGEDGDEADYEGRYREVVRLMRDEYVRQAFW